MEVVHDIPAMRSKADELRLSGKRIGLVPTMGALHEGHLSLIRIARQHADVVITSVYVNPTQFAPNEDFSQYPRNAKRDTELAATAGSTMMFMPGDREMYPEGFLTSVQTDRVASILEGAIRPAHFRGVTTVVAKLFLITKPHVAVFGQKDVQQAFIIRRMIRDLNFDVELIVGPIVREEDGLAKSSRNMYLNASDRKGATVLFRALRRAEELIQAGERSPEAIRKELMGILHSGNPASIDYLALMNPESFEDLSTVQSPALLIAVAARFGTTRLLDNMTIRVSP